MVRVLPALAVGLALAATATGAYASPSARLVYARDAGASSCPTEDALRKAVAARFGYDPFFAWAKQTVVVLVARGRGGFTAHVELVDAQGIARGSRDISSDDPSCAELFDAAALAISIALDASLAEPVAAPLPPAPAPPMIESPAPVPLPPPPARPSPDRLAPRADGPRFALGIDGLSIAGGFAPRATLGGAVFAELAKAGLGSLGLELYGGRSLDATTSPDADVRTTLLAADIVPCGRWRALRACALVELGWLHAEAGGLQQGTGAGSFLGAGGVRVAAEWPAGANVFVRVHADGVALLNDVQLEVDYRTFWRTSRLAGELALGAGYRFP